MIQFDQYFLNGLVQPPTRNFVLVLDLFGVFVDFVLMFSVGFVVVVESESFSKHVFVFLRMMFDVARINEHQSEKSSFLGIWNLYTRICFYGKK